MSAFLNNVRFNPTLGGLTDWIFSSIVSGYQSPVGLAVNGRSYAVIALDASGNWEISDGVYNSGTTTFPRTNIRASSTGSKVNFPAAPTVAVIAAKEDLISIEEDNIFTAAQRTQARKNISAVLKGHLFGMTLSTAGASTTFSVTAGEAADSTGVDLLVAGAFSKTSGAWAVGSGNGAWDGTGTNPASNAIWQHIFVIKRPDTGVVDYLISASATAPTLPANYTLFRRIGSLLTNASGQWIKFIQDNDRFIWDVPVSELTTSGSPNPGTAAITQTLLGTPLGLRVRALLSWSAQANAVTGPLTLYVSDLSVTDTAPGGGQVQTAQVFVSPNTTINFVLGALCDVMTNTSKQIRWRVAVSNAGVIIYLATLGWVDERGRLS